MSNHENMECEELPDDEMLELPPIPFKVGPPREPVAMDLPPVAEILAARKKRRDTQEVLQKLFSLSVEEVSAENSSLESVEINALFTEAQAHCDAKLSVLLLPPQAVVFDPRFSCSIFNEGTLEPSAFFEVLPSNFQWQNLIENERWMLDALNDNIFKVMEPDVINEKSLCIYFFFLMSVHKDYLTVESIYDYLLKCDSFQPSLRDILIVFLNWGADLHRIFKEIPFVCIDISTTLETLPRSIPRDIDDHNRKFVFQYLQYVFVKNFLDSYNLLFEPLLHIALDPKIYSSELQTLVCSLLERLSQVEIDLLIRKYPLSMKFENQSALCCNILRDTPLAVPYAYATLQIFFKEEISYNVEVKMQNVYELLVSKEDLFCRSKPNEIYSLIQLLNLCLRKFSLIFDDENEEYIGKMYEKLVEISANMPEKNGTNDAVVLQEAFAQTRYRGDLRKQIVCEMTH